MHFIIFACQVTSGKVRKYMTYRGKNRKLPENSGEPVSRQRRHHGTEEVDGIVIE